MFYVESVRGFGFINKKNGGRGACKKKKKKRYTVLVEAEWSKVNLGDMNALALQVLIHALSNSGIGPVASDDNVSQVLAKMFRKEEEKWVSNFAL